MMKSMCRGLAGGLVLWAAIVCAEPEEKAFEVTLAAGGQARFPVVTARDASAAVRAHAAQLAEYLGKISGAKFDVITSDGSTGIAVGLAKDFAFAPDMTVREIVDRGHYLLKSHSGGVHLIGATELAVQHAVWDFLYRLGYRQFFPGETWEVIPSIPELKVRVQADERPDYIVRRIWYGYGPWDYAAGPYKEWSIRNRATSDFELSQGHAYEGIISANEAAFKEHQEFYGASGGKRTSTKICIGNPELRKLVVEHALRYFEKKPNADSISMEPSDGGGWCECEACQQLGSITDRVVTLANQVALALGAKYFDKYVGIYAYNQHAAPPNIEVHPRVVVGVATAFLRGHKTVDLLEAWSRKKATCGVREYYAVNVWDRDLPGQGRGGNTAYLRKTIPQFHSLGARFMSAESGDNWGPNGLGYYLASRMMWDVKEADRVEALIEDFLDRAFGPVRGPMAKFYRLIDGANKPKLTSDLVGRLYSLLREAYGLTSDSAIIARLDALTLYVRYVELFRAYSGATPGTYKYTAQEVEELSGAKKSARGEDRQSAFETMIRHAYRMRKTMMIHTKALYRDLVERDKTIGIPPEARWDVKEGPERSGKRAVDEEIEAMFDPDGPVAQPTGNPWKSSRPFSREELKTMLDEGIARNPLLDFEPVDFGEDLVPAKPLGFKGPAAAPTCSMETRGRKSFYTWVDQVPADIGLEATSGLIAGYRDRGDARYQLFPAEEAEGKAVANAAVKLDGNPYQIVLRTPLAGLQRVELEDKNVKTRTTWTNTMMWTLVTSLEQPISLSASDPAYLYVPRGTKRIGGYATGSGEIRDASDKAVHTFNRHKDYFSVPVAEGQDGKLWQVRISGNFVLLTVPPCLAFHPDQLLLPRDVVIRDSPAGQ